MQYRNLKAGEVIQERDERIIWSEWRKCPDLMSGMEVPDVGYRRPLSPEQTANLFREKLADLMEEFGIDCIGESGNELYVNMGIDSYIVSESDEAHYHSTIRDTITSPTPGATE